MKFILTCLGGGQGYTLDDTDLWGLLTALEHGLTDGYLAPNEDWARGMLEKIRTLRAEEPLVIQLRNRFFQDCDAEGRVPNDETLRGWLWFSCPAQNREEVRNAIIQDPRFVAEP